MKKFLKWFGIVLAGLFVLLVIAVVVLIGITSSRLNRTYRLSADPIVIPVDQASIDRGKYLVESVSACTGCHGQDLAGTFFFDDPAIGQIYSANLTPGQGGVGAEYTDADWVHAIRHGVRPGGKPLLIMPSQNFYYYSDEDLGAIIAYLKTVPAVDKESPEPSLTLMARVLFALGAFGKMPAEIIDHTATHPVAPAPGITAAYGEYLLTNSTCRDCHGQQLNGGIAGPGEPYAPNLTPGGRLAQWDEAGFVTALKTGMTPDGKRLAEAMPWEYYSGMADDDLKAIWQYLHSLPALEAAPVN